MDSFTLDDAMETTRNTLKKYQGSRHHDDILQWGYLAAWRTLERYPDLERTHAAALVVASVRNAAADWFRSRENPDRTYVRTGGKPLVALSIDQAQEEWDEEPAAPDETGRVLDEMEAERLLAQYAHTDKEREIVSRNAAGDSFAEIGRDMGLTRKGVFYHMAKVRARAEGAE